MAISCCFRSCSSCHWASLGGGAIGGEVVFRAPPWAPHDTPRHRRRGYSQRMSGQRGQEARATHGERGGKDPRRSEASDQGGGSGDQATGEEQAAANRAVDPPA